MRLFLFMYPIREYLDHYMGQIEEDLWQESVRFSELIRARYRDRGFEIYWLLFGQEGSSKVPDQIPLAEQVVIRPEDNFVSAGITFREMCGWNYPDRGYIRGQLPEEIDELVIGGFHLWDCVDKFAGYCHHRGIPTVVDEDLTEFFYVRTILDGRIPLTRAAGDSGLPRPRSTIQEALLKRRAERPWLAQYRT